MLTHYFSLSTSKSSLLRSGPPGLQSLFGTAKHSTVPEAHSHTFTVGAGALYSLIYLNGVPRPLLPAMTGQRMPGYVNLSGNKGLNWKVKHWILTFWLNFQKLYIIQFQHRLLPYFTEFKAPLVKCTIIYIITGSRTSATRAGCCLIIQLLVVALQKVWKGGVEKEKNIPFPTLLLLAALIIKSTGARLTREHHISSPAHTNPTCRRDSETNWEWGA